MSLSPVEIAKDQKGILLPVLGMAVVAILIAVTSGAGLNTLSIDDTIPSDTMEKKQYDKYPDMILKDGVDYQATIKTNKGDIVVDLFEKETPKTVNSFVFLAREDFFDGLKFHRVIKDFVLQGGDPSGDGTGGPGYQYEDEITDADFAPYVLAMANSGASTNGSQFFITTKDSDASYLKGKHTIFGKVTEGLGVVDTISSVETDLSDAPLEDVVIESITIVEK